MTPVITHTLAPTFRRHLLPPSSGLKIMAAYSTVTTCQTTRRHIRVNHNVPLSCTARQRATRFTCVMWYQTVPECVMQSQSYSLMQQDQRFLHILYTHVVQQHDECRPNIVQGTKWSYPIRRRSFFKPVYTPLTPAHSLNYARSSVYPLNLQLHYSTATVNLFLLSDDFSASHSIRPSLQ